MNTAANPFQSRWSAHDLRRRAVNIVVIVFAAAALLLAVSMLFYLLFYVLRQGIQFINLNFFTKLPTPNGEPGGGMGEAVQGTLILLGLAALFGIPLGLFTGIYLAEFGRGRFANTVRFLVDMLTGIPTIIFGLFAWVFIVVPQQTFSGLAGGVALGIIVIPIVARTTEDVLRLVPGRQIGKAFPFDDFAFGCRLCRDRLGYRIHVGSVIPHQNQEIRRIFDVVADRDILARLESGTGDRAYRQQRQR